MVGAVFSPYLGHLNGWPFLFRKPPKRDGGHGLLALFWQSQTQRKRGDYDDTRNSGYDLCRHRTDNGLRIWSSPTVSNLTKEKTQGGGRSIGSVPGASRHAWPMWTIICPEEARCHRPDWLLFASCVPRRKGRTCSMTLATDYRWPLSCVPR